LRLEACPEQGVVLSSITARLSFQFHEKMASKNALCILGIDGFEVPCPTERSVVAQEVKASYGTAITKENVPVHPQATTDPLDPLNWTSLKKHTILGIVMWL
jgi:hypothetical protein